MGMNKRRGSDPLPIPSWAATVGNMKASCCGVLANCQRCDWHKKPFDVTPIIEERGLQFSLFDFKGVCPKCGQSSVRYLYSPSTESATPYRPCVTR